MQIYFFPFTSLYCCNIFHLILHIHGIFGNCYSMLELLRWLRTYEPWKIFITPFIRGPSMFYKLSQHMLILFVRPFYIMMKVRYLLSIEWQLLPMCIDITWQFKIGSKECSIQPGVFLVSLTMVSLLTMFFFLLWINIKWILFQTSIE